MKTQICGCTVERKIAESKNASIFLGRDGNSVVCLKVLNSTHPSTHEVAQVHNEFEILKILEATRVVPTAPELRSHGSTPVLVTGGCEKSISLDLSIATGPLGVEAFLRVAVVAAEALDRIHGHGVFHKDIKPHNILLRENGGIELINFDIASRTASEEQETRGISQLEGTLAYMSPEQTRRMNRPVDYRTDFYSLGATFYHMLSGDVPFSASNPVDLVHAHLARKPQPLSEKMIGLPWAISDIVGKLLAKNAEDRYKSGIGLRADLQRCLDEWLDTGTIEPFELGKFDVTRQLTIPQKLYGRTSELTKLLDYYDAVAEGGSELLLVGGYSGVGKTALVHELHPHIVKRRGTFISGKFDQFQANTPYSAIGHAFSALIRGLLAEPSSEIDSWKRKLLDGLGDNIQIVIDLVPELEIIVGKQARPEALSLMESRNRFNLVFQNFLGLFVQKERPLVLFLDDLQWADFGSMDLIKTLLIHGSHVLIIGSYRDNEVTAAHPLMHLVTDIKSFRSVEELHLRPLNLSHLQLMLSETFNCSEADSLPLAKLVLTKTGGNPFFTKSFLLCLYREGLLWVDSNDRKWCWDEDRIGAIDITDNVVDLMTRRIQHLPIETQHALRIAASIGNPFELVTLAIASDVSLETAVIDLWKGVADGIVIASEDYSKFLHLAERVRKGESSRSDLQDLIGEAAGWFVHDRVQQAAYSLIPEETRAGVHLRIGQLMRLKEPEECDNLVVVNHLNKGRVHIGSKTERVELAKLNLRASCKAQNASAYQAACEYANVGIDLLEDDWESEFSTAFELYLKGGESNGQLGRFSEARSMLDTAFEHARSDIQKGQVSIVQLAQLAAQGRYMDAVQYGIDVLREFGHRLPAIHDAEGISRSFGEVFTLYRRQVSEKGIDQLFYLPVSEDPRHTSVMSILAAMLDCAVIGLSQYTGLLAVMMVTESCAKGNTTLSSFGYIWCGAILVGGFKNYPEAYLLGDLALKLNQEKFHNKALNGRLLGMYGAFVGEARLPFSKCLETMELAYQECLSSGDLAYASYAMANSRRMSIFQSGMTLPAVTEMMDRGIERLDRLSNTPMLDAVRQHKSAALQLQGLTHHVDSFDYADFDYQAYLRSYSGVPMLVGICRVFEISISSLFGNAREAIAIAESADVSPVEVFIPHIAEIRLFSSLAYARLFEEYPPEEQTRVLAKIRKAHSELVQLAACNQGSFGAHERIVAAQIARIEASPMEVVTRIYDQAIEYAADAELINFEALANELAGEMWCRAECSGIARYYIGEAFRLYEEWGAIAKVRDMEKRFGNVISSLPYHLGRRAPEKPQERLETTAQSLDLEAAVSASRTLSSEIQIPNLLRKMMEIVIKISGAQKAVLLTAEDGRLQVEALMSMEGEMHYQADPLLVDDCRGIAHSVVRYVERTRKMVLLNQAAKDEMFGGDEHIKGDRVKSLMCIPVVNQQKLVALLYLENNIVTGAFTSERVRVIDLLTAQMAISIENARLYSQLEEKVAERTRELEAAQEQLVSTAHQAGMAEIATGVLHNVGNILNSLNVSTQLVESRLAASRVNRLDEIADAISSKYGELLHEIEGHRQGPALIAFTRVFVDVLKQDLHFLKSEMKGIIASVDHINQYIRVQQNYAMTEVRSELVDVQSILESALMLEDKQLAGSRIEVERQYEKVPVLAAQKNKLAHVFLNLVINAREAMASVPESNRRLLVRLFTREVGGTRQAMVEISDTGDGIAHDALSKIFEFGFTTKEHGHGFGLHTVVNAIREMGGRIEVESDGLGRGATFRVSLPIT